MSAARHLGPQLIAYADRFGGSIPGLGSLLDGPLAGAFDGVHVLPFFTPFDGADAGFDPADHTTVDPRLGDWADISTLASDRAVMADLIANHVAASSPQFTDFLTLGEDSEHAPMFLTLSSLWPDGATEADLAAIYRPRPGLPFTPVTAGGVRRLVWTTFGPEQIDLDIRTPQARDYHTRIIDRMTSSGVTMIRLDAIGYVGKAAGTSCFMTPEAIDYTNELREYANAKGATVLLEIHGHYSQQLIAAAQVDYVYDFALPPLVLHAIHAQDPDPLKRWLGLRPENSITVLDTHDGIGIVDVSPSTSDGDEDGLLDRNDVSALVDSIHRASRGESKLATGTAAANLDIYQVNCTFYDAVGSDDNAYLLARLTQLFVPGIPQIYYVGLMAGRNDLTLLKSSGVGRDINRHHFDDAEIAAELKRPVVQSLLSALGLRRTHPAFQGEFSAAVAGSVLTLTWTPAEGVALALEADFGEGRARILEHSASGAVTTIDPLDLDAMARLASA
ncbi:MAG: sucrose phosphorylase [Actinobacteria bacterium HGW-Actinobacteria-4]|nr:MAG: sucrose phosphorylase [Actinobacteria bacterium HGW-Actinobacteria-4]